jgi:regulator of protease activity HflC (stomatin/prohibitin superfamily)
MRSELGKTTLDETFIPRDFLNVNIIQSIIEAPAVWLIQFLRYESNYITPLDYVRQAMEFKVAVERKKRDEVFELEEKSQAHTNLTEYQKQIVVLSFEVSMTDQINRQGKGYPCCRPYNSSRY